MSTSSAPILITGATGFVGSAVARELEASGHRLRALVRPSSNRRNLRGLAAEPVQGDLRDPDSLARAAEGCCAVFHVAADYRLWTRDPSELFASNVTGTENLLRAASERGVERFVYTSSVATLGNGSGGAPADESTPVSIDDMIGDYKRSKFLAEEQVQAFLKRSDMSVVIVNPSTPIGPCDVKPTPTGRVILDAARGRMPAYVDTGLNVVHVEDVARGHRLAFERGRDGERYILGGTDLALREILGEVAACVGRRPPSIRLPHAAVLPIAWVSEAFARLSGRGEPLATVDGVKMSRKKMYFTSAKAADELGYTWRPPGEAIREAVEWFRSEGMLDRVRHRRR